MSLFKCKMCGGNIEFNQGELIGTCDSCGSVQTLPKVNDEAITNLFNRANNLRIKADFDKAASIYEKILNEDNSIAEAHWGLVLCKYGIEYVEDPATYKRVPTCHRAQYESIMTDADYIAALENSDTTQQGIYTQQAIEISNIQKGILAIVKDEKPFDVFICYKESDENGKRTVDSALANDIYYQLTQEGLKVFYAAITLEDKLGQEYEPYIFAALNSAKVMLVVGTKPEYFEAVWVRNEWSRYLKIMKNDRSRLLIPCYRDMDAYDLPEEFAHLQAQDMSKIGFVNDVVRGIKKVVEGSQPKAQVVKETTVINNGGNNTNTDALLKRAYMFLEDGDFSSANEYCEKVLDQNPECAEAYLGKLMAELQIKNKDNLKDAPQPFDDNNNCIKASKFDSAIAEKLKADNEFICKRNENKLKTDIYNRAISQMSTAKTESGFRVAMLDFESIIDWKDSRAKIDECNKKIEEIRIADEKAEERAKSERKRREEEERIADEKSKAKKKKLIAIITPIVAVAVIFLIVLNTVIIPKSNLKKAMALLEAGNYDEAYSMLESLGESETIKSSKYDRAIELENKEEYDAAIVLFNQLTGYKDTEDQIEKCYIGIYGEEKWNKIKNLKFGDSFSFGTYEQDDNTSNGKEEIEWIVLEVKDGKALIISKYALDCQQYNTSDTPVTWETCTLRKWCNEDFYNVAFNAGEQSLIATTKVTADKNPDYSTNAGNDTNDKIFLLSINEVNKYYSTDDSMICKATAYAESKGAAVTYSTGDCFWWLRSPGSNYSNNAAYVFYDGVVHNSGDSVDDDVVCVRPALWIEI